MSNRIFVVGGGPSLLGFDFRRLSKERTIAINAALFDLPACDYFVTMDHTFLRKTDTRTKELQKSSSSKVFICGMHHSYLREIKGAIVDTRYNRVYHLNEFDTVIKSRNPRGCGFSLGDFRNGQNSGHCGLQLAVLLGFTEIYLLGFDMTVDKGRSHYHNLYGRGRPHGQHSGRRRRGAVPVQQSDFESRLKVYCCYMETAIEDIREYSGIQVYSCAKDSPLNNVMDYVSLEDVL